MVDGTFALSTPDGHDAALASLAFINVTWEAQRASYLDNFVPFALEVLRAGSGAMSVTQVRQGISDRFGLEFPDGVVKALTDRAVRKRQVRRVPRSQDLELAPGVADGLPDLVRQQQDCRRQQAALVRLLVEFADRRFDVQWTDEVAEAALIDYVQSHALPMLASSIRGAAMAEAAPDEGSGYVISAFVAECYDRDPTGFEYLDELVKGSMLASVLYLDATGQVSRRFDRTTLYLDTPICLRALGHEGEDAERAAWSFLSLATAQGAELACFEHSVREMRGIIHGARNALARSQGAETAVRGVARHFRSTGATSSDVDLALANLDRDLERRRIRVRATPAYTTGLSVDETRLEEVLQREVGYANELALLADLNSLTAIHRIRRGQSGPHFETCRAALVTTNWNLAKASRRFFNSGRHEWPLVMMDSAVATLLWVKSPAASPDLPTQQIISDCYAAMSPSQSTWSKFVDETERLQGRGVIDQESVALLRYSHEAERALMDLTFGEARRINETTVRGVLDRAKAAAAAPTASERDAALDRVNQAEEAEARARFEAEVHLAAERSLQARLDAMEGRERQRAQAIAGRITDRVAVFERCAKAVGILVVCVATLLGIGSFFPAAVDWIPAGARPWMRALAVVAVVASGVILWQGASIKAWIESTRDRMIGTRLQREGIDVPIAMPEEH
jgi:hypothetical protein